MLNKKYLYLTLLNQYLNTANVYIHFSVKVCR